MTQGNKTYRNTALTASLAIAIVGTLSATAQANPTPAIETAQAPGLLAASIEGQCRGVNTSNVGIFSGPTDTTGTRVSVVAKDSVVRLAGDGSNGWIKVDYPKDGYIQAKYLYVANCPANLAQKPTPPADGDLCRRIISPPEGLVIRSEATSTSANVGGVAQYGRVTLSSNPATTSKDSAGRTWVKISAPANGWISNGLPGSGGHIVLCSATNPPTNPPTNPQPQPQPPTTASRCRRVINPPEGLLILKEARSGSGVVGGVGFRERMTLTSAPATTSKDSTGRTWVKIEAPAAGWVSNGTGGTGNIGFCE